MTRVDTIEKKLIENRLTDKEIKKIGAEANRELFEHYERTNSECYENWQHLNPVWSAIDYYRPRPHMKGFCAHCQAGLKRYYNNEELKDIAEFRRSLHIAMIL